MFDKYDFVKIIDYPDRECRDLEKLVGKEAMIIDVDRKYEYPYELCFMDREAQELSMWHGNLLFNDYHLEPVGEKNLEGAKRELKSIRDSLKYPQKVDRIRLIDNLRRIERML